MLRLNYIHSFNRRPALHYAAYGGFHGCISLLLESGIDVDAKDKTGVTALHWACASGSLDTVKLLFRFDAFPNYRELEGERLTPLDYAIIRDHQDVAQVYSTLFPLFRNYTMALIYLQF